MRPHFVTKVNIFLSYLIPCFFIAFLPLSPSFLLISLIIISILVAAFAPVVTKKLKSQKVAVGSGGGLKTRCSGYGTPAFDDDCKICKNIKNASGVMELKCVACFKTGCGENQYLDNEICKCVNCSNSISANPKGFGANCLNCMKSTGCVKCKDGYIRVRTNNTSPYTCSTSNCNTQYGDGYSTSCKPCPVGYYCENGIKKQCPVACKGCLSNNKCTSCDRGFYLTSGGQCKPCKDGYFCPGDTQQPIACTIYGSGCGECNETGCTGSCKNGFIELKNSKYYCTDCNKFSPACAACTSSGCTNCNRISYNGSSNGYIISGTGCTLCPAGYSCTGSNSINKNICSIGTYSIAGDYTCHNCTSGYCTVNTGATSCISNTASNCQTKNRKCHLCDRCNSSYRLNTNPGTCSTCPVGVICDGTTNISNCQAGYYLKNGICSECEKGYKCINSVRTQCNINNNEYQDLTKQSTCKTCENGYYATANGCKVCSEKYGEGCSACTPITCTGCGNGTYMADDGKCTACTTKYGAGCALCTSYQMANVRHVLLSLVPLVHHAVLQLVPGATMEHIYQMENAWLVLASGLIVHHVQLQVVLDVAHATG